jgi:hypothetical protein
MRQNLLVHIVFDSDSSTPTTCNLLIAFRFGVSARTNAVPKKDRNYDLKEAPCAGIDGRPIVRITIRTEAPVGAAR